MSSLSSITELDVSGYTLDVKYRAFIESIRGMLINDENTSIQPIQPEVGYKHRGNLTELLLDAGIPYEDHYLILRVNGLCSIHDIDENLKELIIPNRESINHVKKLYRQSLK